MTPKSIESEARNKPTARYDARAGHRRSGNRLSNPQASSIVSGAMIAKRYRPWYQEGISQVSRFVWRLKRRHHEAVKARQEDKTTDDCAGKDALQIDVPGSDLHRPPLLIFQDACIVVGHHLDLVLSRAFEYSIYGLHSTLQVERLLHVPDAVMLY
jgi:hypothetical protein